MSLVLHPRRLMPRRAPAAGDEAHRLWLGYVDAVHAHHVRQDRATGAALALAYAAFVAALPQPQGRLEGADAA